MSILKREEMQKVLKDRDVPPIVISILGSAIGTLVDYGLSPEEISGICGCLIAVTSNAANDPAVKMMVRNFRDVLKEA